MQKLAQVKKRIKSIETIQTITNTLATVSAAKLSKIKNKAAGLQDYSNTIYETLSEQQYYLKNKGISLSQISPLFKEKRDVKNVVCFMISADKGTCGNYNLAILWESMRFLKDRVGKNQNVSFIAKGKKGARYLRKKGLDISHTEGWRRQGFTIEDVERLLNHFIKLFLTNEADEIHIAYTQFFSPIVRKPRVKRFLPIGMEEEKMSKLGKLDKWNYEPSFKAIIYELLYMYLRVQLIDVLIESFASEQGARMITMQEATERAKKKLDECVINYNRLRREVITLDLLGAIFAPKTEEKEIIDYELRG